MRPLFAKGKTNERTLSGAVAAGSYRLPVDNAPVYFSPGDLIFVSDADGGRTECAGAATAVFASEVRCLAGLSQGRSAGALCWKPTQFFSWPNERAMPVSRTLDTGVEARRSAGGVLYLAKIREGAHQEILRFDNLRKVHVALFIEWMTNHLNGGVEPFTLCDERGAVSVVAIVSSRIAQDEKSEESVRLEIEIECLEREAYL